MTIPGVLVDLVAIIVIGAIAYLRALEGRDAATAILVIVVGRLRPPVDLPGAARATLPSSSGIITILAALGALVKGRMT